MYLLKQIPEDFIVDEIPDRKFSGEKQKYCIYILKKTKYNTEDAVSEISKRLNVPRKNIGYAGAKDRNAVTSQFISILGSGYEVELKDIKMTFAGYSDLPISLGSLEGNKFKITIRNLDDKETKIVESNRNMKNFVNYFDSQRFSSNNAVIGRMIIEKKYKDACAVISDENSKNSEQIKIFLEAHKNAFLNALKVVPKKTLLIYVHAYQSLLWNRAVEKLMQMGKNIEKVPLLGFGTELDDEIKQIYDEILLEENISLRDFILRDFPEISLEGDYRNMYAEINNLIVNEPSEDELNPGKNKIVVEFSLNKGAYATMAVKNIVG